MGDRTNHQTVRNLGVYEEEHCAVMLGTEIIAVCHEIM
jgi:hypothetical protein